MIQKHIHIYCYLPLRNTAARSKLNLETKQQNLNLTNTLAMSPHGKVI